MDLTHSEDKKLAQIIYSARNTGPPVDAARTIFMAKLADQKMLDARPVSSTGNNLERWAVRCLSQCKFPMYDTQIIGAVSMIQHTFGKILAPKVNEKEEQDRLDDAAKTPVAPMASSIYLQDNPGMGKTITAIAALRLFRVANERGR